MRFPIKLTSLHIAGAALIVSTFAAGCTSKITEEQLRQIQDLRAKERQLSSDITKAQGDRSRLDTEVGSRQNEVRKCNEDKAFVQQKLSQWPGVWPDYTEPAPPPPAPTKSKKRR